MTPTPTRTEPAAAKDAKDKKLFVAKTAAVGGDGLAIRPGEVAVEGAEILRTHGHLFKPLEITYRA